MNRMFVTVLAAGILAGCAKPADRIGVIHNDPNAFRDMDCDTLKVEIVALDDWISREGERLDRRASADGFQLTASILISPLPIGLGTEGNNRNVMEEELRFGKAKGRAIGMRREAMRKGCSGTEHFPDEIAAIERNDYRFVRAEGDAVNSLTSPVRGSANYSMP